MSRKKKREPEISMMDTLMWSTWRDEAWQPFRRAWIARGFTNPPSGDSEEDHGSQRAMLWEIARARSNDLARWVIEAPGKTRHDVIDHVLLRWHEIAARASLDEVRAKADSLERSMDRGRGPGRPGDPWSQRVDPGVRPVVSAEPTGLHSRLARPVSIGSMLRANDSGPRQGRPDDGKAGAE